MPGIGVHRRPAEARVSKRIRCVIFAILVAAGIRATRAAESGIWAYYDVTIPDEWKPELSVGKFAVSVDAFYGVPW